MSNYYKRNELSKRSGSTSLRDSINELLETYKLTRKFKETHVINAWGKVMGQPIATRTGKIFIRDRKLFVEITSSPLKHQLSMAKAKMITLLNQDAGYDVIDDVVLL